jgi:hypothetical protein
MAPSGDDKERVDGEEVVAWRLGFGSLGRLQGGDATELFIFF